MATKEFYDLYTIVDESKNIQIICDIETLRFNIRNKHTQEIMSPIWFNKCKSLFMDDKELFEVFTYEKGYNFINSQGTILSPMWSADRIEFINGLARIMAPQGYNFVNTNGDLLSPMWFDYADNFYFDNTPIKINGKGWNWLKPNGEFISAKWFEFDEMIALVNNFAIVHQYNKGYNLINTNGNLISAKWFDYCGNFYNGFAIVANKDKSNFINTNGEILSKIDFNMCMHFSEGFAQIFIKDKGWNYINTKGELLSPNEWFTDCYEFCNGAARVHRFDESINYINTNGEILFPNEKFQGAKDMTANGVVNVFNEGKGWYTLPIPN